MSNSKLENNLSVSKELWDTITAKKAELFDLPYIKQLDDDSNTMVLKFLNKNIYVCLEQQAVFIKNEEKYNEERNSLLELCSLLYLAGIKKDFFMTGNLINYHSLTSAHFFRGPHEIRFDSLIMKYGRNPEKFINAAKKFEGQLVNMAAELTVRFISFPNVPLYYILWAEDDEFPARMNVMFDGSIEKIFAADGIWALINLVSDRLYMAG